MNKKNINYTVSVRLMTYMHAPFIKEAMDGIIIQKTNFKVEVIVGDDFSTDGTLDIIRSYSDTENIHIKILKREKGDEYWQKRQEIGRLHNFNNILENCSGRYVALLDGDDYWTDPLKLQKQVDFLEDNPDYSLCFTNCSTVDSKGKLRNPRFIKYTRDKSFTKEDLMFVAPTLTRVVRNKSIEINPFFFESKEAPGDAKMLINNLHKGKAKYLNFISGHYRKHSGGVWSNSDVISIRKSKFETAFYGMKVSERKIKMLFLKKAMLELSKLYVLDKKSHNLKLIKLNKEYRKLLDLNKIHFYYFNFYLIVLWIPFISRSTISKIQLFLVKRMFY